VTKRHGGRGSFALRVPPLLRTVTLTFHRTGVTSSRPVEAGLPGDRRKAKRRVPLTAGKSWSEGRGAGGTRMGT
jgi:hypothetical protein